MDAQDIVLENIVCEKPTRGDSLKKRWLYKFFANTAGFGIGFIIQMIVPRGLGPNAYGDFSFLNNFFSQFLAFFDMGTSTCFYTKLSRRPKEHGIVSFYLYFAGFVIVSVTAFVGVAMATGTYPKFWPGQQAFYIFLAAGCGILGWITMVFSNMADAYGITVIAEKIKMLQKTIALLLAVSLYVFHQMNLANYFYLQYAILIFLGSALIYIMKHQGFLSGQRLIIAFDEFKKYLKEFYIYTHPLILYSFIGVFANILDRWLLQFFSGSAQQGFFGFSFQISALCFLFTGALTPLLMREFSIAYAKKDLKEMGRLFQRYIPLVLIVTAFLTCFMASQAPAIVQIVGGDKYKNSIWPLFIMAFYPICQVYGQICGSVFLAGDETRLYCNIGIFFMVIGIPITYFLIAPRALWGLDSGAAGLGIKTMLMQILGVNALLYHNARMLKFSFRKYLVNQISTVGALLIFAFLAALVVDSMFGPAANNILRLFFAGLFYTATTAITIYFFPALFALKREDIDHAVGAGLGKLKAYRRPGDLK